MERPEKQFTNFLKNPVRAIWERLIDLTVGNFGRSRWTTKALILGGGTALILAAA